ncbi:ATP-binding cassette domain-containing protein [Actinomadura namibiensis]|uniref:ABC-2 type transport system ATP-binding protein n=1 Tax=Actinomadura namibiensis TaxID=182080 RepID=A0A7W3LIM4_ACTNM|nr:ATP-binding cassette domain-containing protein [Actinomadura namibiensis]MBA8948785.1 ABC-2 type transport system ATP-binding protein [Actinomadura namibiensis]
MILVEELVKHFGAVRAVDGLSFAARPGQVTGFLGPNGAGKTTTLRMLLGLVEPTSGRALIDGRRYADLGNPVERVGAALEATGFHPGRTARDHLRVTCLAAGLPTGRADEALELAGLADAADRRVVGFSLGMRQRLALAAAVLGQPPVLILDEPANGLDPAGIHWLRGFLRHLAGLGCTVLVSSHVLAEVEQTADHVVIVARGKVVRDAPLAELVGEDGGGLLVGTEGPDDAAGLAAALERAGATVRVEGERLRVSGVAAAEVGRAALAAGAVLTELSAGRSGLEKIFLELTMAEFGGTEPAAGDPAVSAEAAS